MPVPVLCPPLCLCTGLSPVLTCIDPWGWSSTFGLAFGGTLRDMTLLASDSLSLAAAEQPGVAAGSKEGSGQQQPGAGTGNAPPAGVGNAPPSKTVVVTERIEPCPTYGGKPCGGEANGVCVSRQLPPHHFQLQVLSMHSHGFPSEVHLASSTRACPC